MPGRRIKHTNNPSLNQRRESFQINKNLNAPFRPRPGNLQQLRPEENYVQASDFSKEISNKFFRQQQNIPATTISSDQLNRTIDANIESKAIKAQKIRANDEGVEFNQVQTPNPDTIFLRFRGPQSEIGIEQTFKLQLTSFPYYIANGERPLSIPTYPDLNFESLNENDREKFSKYFDSVSRSFTIQTGFMISDVNDEKNNFFSDYFRTVPNNFNLEFIQLNLKKNRRYRFDLSHPSLSVIVDEPSEFISIDNEIQIRGQFPFLGAGNIAKGNTQQTTDVSEVIIEQTPRDILDDPIMENKFLLYEDRTPDISDTSRGALTGLLGDRINRINEVERIFVPPEIRDDPLIQRNPYFDGEFLNYPIINAGLTSTNKTYLSNTLSAFYGQEKPLEFIEYNGIPGTEGAYMDLIIPNNCPSTIFLINSAYPQYYQIKSINNNEENKLLRLDKSPLKSDYNFFTNDEPNFDLKILINTYEDINLVDEVITDTSITDNFLVPGFLNLPISSNYTKNPLAKEEILLSSAEINFHLSENWKNTRINTLSCFANEILPKIPVNPAMLSNKLSALNYQFSLDYGFEGYDLGYSDTKRISKTKKPFIQDYLIPFKLEGTKVTGWNEKFFGYNNRDLFDFSGVTVQHKGVSNSHQGVLITPKHVLFGAHWGNTVPKVGHVLYFLEKNTGILSHGIVVDTFSFYNKRAEKNKNNLEFPKFDSMGDTYLVKLDRDMTIPNPDVEGSDGSVKVYKLPHSSQPVFFNRPPEEEIMKEDLNLRFINRNFIPSDSSSYHNQVALLTSNPVLSYQLQAAYQRTYRQFQRVPLSSFFTNTFEMSGFRNVTGLPRLQMFGYGAFGRQSYGIPSNNFVTMKPCLGQFNIDEFSYKMDLESGGLKYREVPFLSSNGFPLSTCSYRAIGRNKLSVPQLSYTNFNILTTSYNKKLNFYNNTNIPFNFGTDADSMIPGDSNNPEFIIVKNYKGEGPEIILNGLISSSVPKMTDDIDIELFQRNGGKINPPERIVPGSKTSGTLQFVYNWVIDNVFDGGNTEGFYVSSFDLT